MNNQLNCYWCGNPCEQPFVFVVEEYGEAESHCLLFIPLCK